ncbi:bifunctional folylpolyglutamate synthase/dihydrofolate synthase [Leptospira levettii]|uniref:bifunctional folylpolyglutamate synthase/dihydrofolate synthase n=1 Tax=Leptospira levettii TaxID=2023178 RepID=UPI0010847145|nr:bifunctional folylpolyglutamate synthase/dihydrofolate synthase [Leptospira levettii]TGM69965.1 bifunctional folylpolyglutamate synthase/dihydrofolate synthase [Leptospira levettii]
MQFIEFLNQRQNIEKTRNFNVFQNYSLDGLKSVFEHIERSFDQKKPKPIRISVVGTNGKGSTSHYLACLFSKLGYNTGLYTSPHLLTPLERLQLVRNGEPSLPNIEDINLCFQNFFLADLHRYDSLSYFEFLTVFAYRFFHEQNMEVEIWEAGLGGRLDATKLVEADYIVLTKIGLDHSAILGNTKEAICQEKLGITGEKTLSLFAFQEEVETLPESFHNRPKKELVPLHVISIPPKESYLETNFLYAKNIVSKILKEQQSSVSKIPYVSIRKPKGRMEVLSDSPLVVFDPSHNPDAIGTTSFEFAKHHKKFHILLGSLPDKDLTRILDALPEPYLENLILWEGEGFGRFPAPTGKLKERTIRHSSLPGLVPLFQGEIPVLVLGSFRLYGIVANLIQNTIKM